MKFTQIVSLVVVSITLSILGSGCGSSPVEQGQESKLLVCDPFNKTKTLTSKNGIIGTISSIDANQVTASSTVAQLQATGEVYDATLVLNSINVPTIAYDDGFTSTDGRPLWNTGGGAVSEFFALHLEGQLDVPDGEEGWYQFALVSDDGATFKINDQVVVDNDGLHQTQFRAGGEGQAVYIGAGQKVPFKLDFYQGQLVHLALTLLWRKVGTNELVVPTAGDLDITGIPTYADNAVFWTPGSTPEASWAVETLSDPTDPTSPTNWDLVESKFSVIGADRFSIPETIETNPCAE